MKNSINFFPRQLEKKSETPKSKLVRLVSIVILTVFLIFNLVIFGLYFFLKKNTNDALVEINRQEAVITNLSSTENLYRQLKQKLSFLTLIWREPQKVNAGLVFVNGFMGPEAGLQKMNFNQDGLIALNLSSLDSSNLELFLNKTRQAEEDKKIRELKIDSVNKASSASPSAYEFVLNFKLREK